MRREPTVAELLVEHRDLIEHALRNEAIAAQADERMMRQVAVALRDGRTVPLFAPGEDGARAADQVAAAHKHRQVAAEDLLAALDAAALDAAEAEPA